MSKLDSLIKEALKASTILSALDKRRKQLAKFDRNFDDIVKTKFEKNKDLARNLMTSNLENSRKVRIGVRNLENGYYTRLYKNKFTKN